MSMSVPATSMWRKSTASQPGGNCVEVGLDEVTVQIRDSWDQSGTVLSITQAGWQDFLAGTREGGNNSIGNR
jgi:hypothetical protein